MRNCARPLGDAVRPCPITAEISAARDKLRLTRSMALSMSSALNQLRDRFLPGQLWPDTDGVHINAHGGGILFHEGIYYWFGEHKIAGEVGNTAQVGVSCYCSTDLYNWQNRGVALAVSDDPASPIARGCVLERPKVLYNAPTRRFVMWFHLERRGSGYADAWSAVAASNTITGPYQFFSAGRLNAQTWPIDLPAQQRRPLNATEASTLAGLNLPGGPVPGYPTDLIFRRDFTLGQMSRDMTVFVDDDGAAYHIHSSEDNGVLHLSQLSDDYLRCDGKYIRLFPGRFHEAPALFKHAGHYWIITSGCTGWAPNAARLSVAPSIWGPWQELGNPCLGPGANLTFDGQSTHVLPIHGQSGAFIFMADRWRATNAIDGRYLWLPIQFRNGRPVIEWMEEWDVPGHLGRIEGATI